MKKYSKLLIVILPLIAVGFATLHNYYKFDAFGFTNSGKFYLYYATKLKLPERAHGFEEYSDRSGFPADGTEVLTFRVSGEDMQKLLEDRPFGQPNQWHKGPYDGCLQGFLEPCDPASMFNKFQGDENHIKIKNSDKLIFASINSETYSTDGPVVLILDTENLRVLVYKYVS